MNWYKIAKLADVGNEVPTYVYCPLCKNIATENENENEVSWKPYFKMTPQEQMQIDEAREASITGEIKFTSQVCPNCKVKNK